MILDATCQISFTATAPIPAIMMLRPRSGYAQWITREEYAFEPHAPVVEYTDGFGNLCQRVLIPSGQFDVHCSCRAHTADTIDVDPSAAFVPVHQLPETALQFLLPSRYCQSDLLNDLSSSIVGELPAGYAQVAAIEQWLRDENAIYPRIKHRPHLRRRNRQVEDGRLPGLRPLGSRPHAQPEHSRTHGRRLPVQFAADGSARLV